MTSPDQRSFARRLLGALRLEASTYEEVEHDADALWQAAVVVALGGVAEGVLLVQSGGWGAPVVSLIGGFLGWFAASGVVWLVGVRLMGCSSDFAELLRALGFATAPRILLVAGLLPLGPALPILRLAVAALTVGAFVIASRQALDVSTGRAVVVCVLAVAVSILFGMLLAGPRALGF
jgi:hypothetical protein